MTRAFDPHRFGELDALLREALDREGDDRRAFVAGIEATRPDIAERLLAMLAAADAADDRLASLLDAGVWAALADADARRFGAWRATATLAHGGMARVLAAERADGAFEQRAAIKCLWPGLATPEIVARFEQERQILARLDDPRIARLLDGGVRADGVPWLALEFVDGRPIDAHADALRLDLDARLALWDEVAAAVAIAHRQLVVHRDLKPGNVLVRDDGAVKLLDFGIAKLLDPDGFPHAAPTTRIESRALTRDYASPEQLRGEPVTTASDVHQLGLLLYELATGVQPFRSPGLAARERERRILEDDAAPPSASATQGADAIGRAARRASTPRALARRLRGDFDAIVQRAIDKSPGRRYVSVDALREDVLRWRASLPVAARRAGVAARTGKWLRRHRVAAAAAAAVVAIGLAYALTAIVQARALAREAAVNRAVRDYLVGWFQEADPGGTEGRDPRASEMLADGLARARRELTAQPELKAEILSIVGEVYMARGDYARAEPVLVEAHDLAGTLPRPDAEPRGASAGSLATLLHYTGRYAQSEAMFEEALAQRIANAGENGYWTLVTRQGYADLLQTRGRYGESMDAYRLALAGARRTLGESDPLTANIERALADVERDFGRDRDAHALYAAALVTQREAHGELHPNTAATRLGLGRLLLEEGRIEEAAAEIEPAFAAFRAVRGESTPATGYWERVVAELEEARGDFAAAGARLARIGRAMEEQLGPAHLIVGYIAIDRGYVALAEERDEEAVAAFRSAERVFDRIAPEGHPRRVAIRLGQALIARRAHDREGAERLLDTAQNEARAKLSPEHPLVRAIAAARPDAPRLESGDRALAMLRVARAIGSEIADAR